MKGSTNEGMQDLTGRESEKLRRETPEVSFVTDVAAFVTDLGNGAKAKLASLPKFEPVLKGLRR